MEKGILYGKKEKLSYLGYDEKQQVTGIHMLLAWETLVKSHGLAARLLCLSADGKGAPSQGKSTCLGRKTPYSPATGPPFLYATCRPVCPECDSATKITHRDEKEQERKE